MKNVFWLSVAVSGILACMSATWYQDNDRRQTDDLVSSVRKVLETNGRSGSIMYRGTCTPSGGITESFKISEFVETRSSVQALRDAFANEPTLKVREDASGMVRVTGGNVQEDLLGLRLRQVVFRGERNPRDATTRVLETPEVKHYMQTHHMDFIAVAGGLIPPPSGVRLTGTRKDESLSDTLDQIAREFPGMWVYGECQTARGERHVYLTFDEFSPQPSTH